MISQWQKSLRESRPGYIRMSKAILHTRIVFESSYLIRSDKRISYQIAKTILRRCAMLPIPTNVVFKNTADLIVPHLGPIFRATFKLQKYLRHWANTETLMLRKPGKRDYTTPGAWRPIVLSDRYARLLNTCINEEVSVLG